MSELDEIEMEIEEAGGIVPRQAKKRRLYGTDLFRDSKHKEEYIPMCASDDKYRATLQTIHLPDNSRFSHNE
jgi:hypothetical protein